MNPWSACKNLLIVRGDNMGDLILSAPAIRALKQTFGCGVTVLTSESAAPAVSLIPDIDDVIKADLPWVEKDASISPARLLELMSDIRSMQFDGAVIFTVYSQSALPAALFAWECGIPLRLAYCRENPYELLTHWIPDKEPYNFIRHQVMRDKILVKNIGAQLQEDDLQP